jgi:predicted Zn-ribbon and HTH transcriptional regulator
MSTFLVECLPPLVDYLSENKTFLTLAHLDCVSRYTHKLCSGLIPKSYIQLVKKWCKARGKPLTPKKFENALTKVTRSFIENRSDFPRELLKAMDNSTVDEFLTHRVMVCMGCGFLFFCPVKELARNKYAYRECPRCKDHTIDGYPVSETVLWLYADHWDDTPYNE